MKIYDKCVDKPSELHVLEFTRMKWILLLFTILIGKERVKSNYSVVGC